MPAFEQHRDKAVHNEDLVTELNNPYWDWAITISFYAALQYVEAFLARKGIHSPNHTVRDEIIQRDPVLRKIYDEYRQLKDDSHDARYDARVTHTQDDYGFAKKYLETVKMVVIAQFPV